MEEEETYQEDYDRNSVNSEIIGGFFDIDRELIKLELRWKGLYFDENNIDLLRVAGPIASDEFINSTISSLKTIVNQNFSISSLIKDDAYRLILDKDIAIYSSVAEEGTYFKGDFDLFKEDVDSFLQIFMGHIINSHGINSATSLQAGVVAEKNIQNAKNSENSLEKAKRILLEVGGNKENE